MTTKIYVAKYIKDTRRWEPRNVGILVASEDSCASRFIGEQQDGRINRTAVRYRVNDTDTYREWVEYWKRTLTPGSEGIGEIVARTHANYWVAEAGEVRLGSATPNELVEDFYSQLVADDDGKEEATDLRPEVDQLLEQAGITKAETFRRNFDVKAAFAEPVFYRFHYYWENGHKMVGHRLSSRNLESFRSQLWKFEHLPDDVGTVAFLSFREERPEVEAELGASRISEAIDVTDKDALERVVALFQ